jgi:hypothetical protein
MTGDFVTYEMDDFVTGCNDGEIDTNSLWVAHCFVEEDYYKGRLK